MDSQFFFDTVHALKRLERATIFRYTPDTLTKSEQKLFFCVYANQCQQVPQEQLTVSALSHQLQIKPASTIHLINALVARGLMTRSDAPHDRRISYIALSELGQRLAEETVQHNIDLFKHIHQKLGADVTHMVDTIHRLIDVLETYPISTITMPSAKKGVSDEKL